MAIAAVYSPNAMALNRDTCLPFNQMVAAMEAEGQYDIIKIDDLAPNGEVGLTTYTTNDNMNRGYEISGTRPANGGLPLQLCVVGVMRDIKIHNAWSRTVPANFYVQNTLTAQQVSTAMQNVLGGIDYGDHNTGLNIGQRNSTLPALQARLLRADGSDGALLTVTVDVSNRTGTAWATRSDGLSMTNVIFRNFTYTNEGLRIIREQQARRQQVTAVPSTSQTPAARTSPSLAGMLGEPSNIDIAQIIASGLVATGQYGSTQDPTVMKKTGSSGGTVYLVKVTANKQRCTSTGAVTYSCAFTYKLQTSIPSGSGTDSLAQIGLMFQALATGLTQGAEVAQKTYSPTLNWTGPFHYANGKWTSPEFASAALATARQQAAAQDRAAQARRSQAQPPRTSGQNCRTETAVIGKNRTWVPGPPEFGGGYWDEDDVYGPKYVCD